MRIAFICGTLEPGRDGVGDYTRRLAEGIIKRGHQVLLISLYDKYVSSEVSSTHTNDACSQFLRIPSSYSTEKRKEATQKTIHSFDPQWISLQYVPFSFHPKGLPFDLYRFIKNVLTDRKLHIMFHELWVGMDLESSFKHRLWGSLQRQIVKQLIKKLRPDIVHTSIRLYQLKLSEIGAKAEVLELFGNIPVVAKREKQEKDNSLISFAVFGGIHYGAPVEMFAKEVALYAKNNSLTISLSFIGRCGAEQDKWVAAWKSEGLPVEIFGEQPEEYISRLLSNATAGIATTPVSLVEKSGSVAAMREHELPVICISRKWQARKMPDPGIPDGILEYREGNFSSLFSKKMQLKSNNEIEYVVDQFLSRILL